AKLRTTLLSRRGSCSSSRKYLVILFICSQLQRFLLNKMFRSKGILLVTTILCFPGVISASCPRSNYTALKDTLQSPRNSMGKYPANQSCTYDVRVPAGKRIILAFKSFNISGSMPHCPQDSLEIIVGFVGGNLRQSFTFPVSGMLSGAIGNNRNDHFRYFLGVRVRLKELNEFCHFNFRCGNLSRSLGKFCSCSNLSMPNKIYTYDNCLTLVFISDNSTEGLGFLAEYNTTDNNETRM
ncbi:unnamed protein product, partial [Porites evermanni]